ncbi:MAG: pilin [Patescibacteria group bacterium]|nr:pilin [Patescibacteria group bacterium]
MFFSVLAASLNEWCRNPNDPTTCCLVDGVPTLKCLEIVFGNIITISSTFIVLVLFLFFVMGSFNYLTSFGNPDKIKKAQGTLKMALIGFFLFISSYLILNIICFLAFGKLGDDCPLFHFQIGE